QLAGQRFVALNGGPARNFTEAFSLMVSVDTQQERDTLWARLTENGGEESRCGWLKDPSGVSWQIIPARFGEIMASGNPEGTQRAFKAMMSRRKLIIADLVKAYEGR